MNLTETNPFPIAFHVSSFFAGGREPVVDRLVVEVTTKFLEQWSEHFKWFVEDETGTFRPYMPELARYPAKYLRDPSDAPRRSWMAHGGENKHETSAWYCYAALSSEADTSRLYELRRPVLSLGSLSPPLRIGVKRFTMFSSCSRTGRFFMHALDSAFLS